MTGVQTCALPISASGADDAHGNGGAGTTDAQAIIPGGPSGNAASGGEGLVADLGDVLGER